MLIVGRGARDSEERRLIALLPETAGRGGNHERERNIPLHSVLRYGNTKLTELDFRRRESLFILAAGEGNEGGKRARGPLRDEGQACMEPDTASKTHLARR
jgi:hypothetical protein